MQRKQPEPLTEYEWQQLPITFRVGPMSRVCCTTERWVSDHAKELGGFKVAGHWTFSKSAVAKMLGIGE